ncbi:NAD(P)/FAD-dependent oxidoreductase [Streptomyces sp. NPDC057638]|uniref:NAD(P)/FAD-dependent oxidoreductase n=1 Tax=Streptomyces sp. NPDC057638 TaxID=3346190 RepID=UPI0036928139
MTTSSPRPPAPTPAPVRSTGHPPTPAPFRRGQRVVVLGAGYAGLMAALRLAPHARVTLVDPADRFTERVRHHERTATSAPTARDLSLARMLRGTGVRHLAHRATALDPAARLITTDDGRTLPYDRLVYALGSHTGPPPAGTPTTPADDRVFTAESADALRARLIGRPHHHNGLPATGSPRTLAVVGGGLTGVEMAAELAESHPDWHIRLLSAGDVVAGHSPRGRAHVRATLTALGVRVEEGVQVDDPGTVDADLVLWAAAMAPSTELAAGAGLALDPGTGRIAVDATLRSLSHPDIHAVGDAAAAHSPRGGTLRMGCATALPTGSHAASVLIAESRGRQPEPLRFGYVIQCVSLGRHDGVIQFVHPDDSPRDRVLTGRRAAFVKERVVRFTVHSLGLARRFPAAVPRVTGMG